MHTCQPSSMKFRETASWREGVVSLLLRNHQHWRLTSERGKGVYFELLRSCIIKNSTLGSCSGERQTSLLVKGNFSLAFFWYGKECISRPAFVLYKQHTGNVQIRGACGTIGLRISLAALHSMVTRNYMMASAPLKHRNCYSREDTFVRK